MGWYRTHWLSRAAMHASPTGASGIAVYRLDLRRDLFAGAAPVECQRQQPASRGAAPRRARSCLRCRPAPPQAAKEPQATRPAPNIRCGSPTQAL
eukprot:5363713-Pleurochrysis_carterae.AAC.1